MRVGDHQLGKGQNTAASAIRTLLELSMGEAGSRCTCSTCRLGPLVPVPRLLIHHPGCTPIPSTNSGVLIIPTAYLGKLCKSRDLVGFCRKQTLVQTQAPILVLLGTFLRSHPGGHTQTHPSENLGKVLAVLPSGFLWPVMECTLQEKVQLQRRKRTCPFSSHFRLQAGKQTAGTAPDRTICTEALTHVGCRSTRAGWGSALTKHLAAWPRIVCSRACPFEVMAQRNQN